ncbi:MAG: exodeoxyribonuclease VII small subunit [Candidatus Eutrophobiaceae bacterium]
MDTKQDFEKTLSKLEGIIQRMEGGEVGLEESMELFEDGMGLVKGCQKTLKEAEQKLLTLSRDGGEEQLEEHETKSEN